MQSSPPESINSIGYLACYVDESLGFVGGLLVVNEYARPVEFHCSAPFRPSSAQRVLYGETLEPDLLANQIPSALLGKARSQPESLIVPDALLLEYRCSIDIPMGSLNFNPEASVPSSLDGLHQDLERAIEFQVNPQFELDRSTITRALSLINRHVAIEEPMERLRIAIQETCKPNSNAA